MPRYLVIGSGGREHAIAWKLAQEKSAHVFVAPGNDGIARTAGCACVTVDIDDHDALLALATELEIDLTVVGPEAPLCAGLADRFRAEGRAIFGPSADAAKLEGSKAFAKEIMTAASVPTAEYDYFNTLEPALEHVALTAHPLVIKADGLAGGKGVVISESISQSEETLRAFMDDERFGDASTSVVIEECLVGPELSFMVVTDGETIVPLSTSRDHKRIGEGDTGPNTGGMGAITPSPDASDALRDTIIDTVIRPTLEELARRGASFCGFLYAGLMLTEDGPRVLEFNVRLGDPETQALLLAMDQELGPVLDAAARGELTATTLETSSAACCVVLASEGYPRSSSHGDVMSGVDAADALDDVVVFHAGTARREGEWVTAGGRVLGVTARGGDAQTARQRAYEAVARIDWRQMQLRRDIGR